MTKGQYLASLTNDERSYLEAALWSSTTENGEPLDKEHEARDFSMPDLKRMVEEWREFREANIKDIESTAKPLERYYGCSPECRAAHDFWLTRNGHGAGFWDRGYPDDLGDRLTKAAKAAGSRDLYVHRGLVRIM